MSKEMFQAVVDARWVDTLRKKSSSLHVGLCDTAPAVILQAVEHPWKDLTSTTNSTTVLLLLLIPRTATVLCLIMNHEEVKQLKRGDRLQAARTRTTNNDRGSEQGFWHNFIVHSNFTVFKIWYYCTLHELSSSQ